MLRTPFLTSTHALCPLALWYWGNMHIQLLSFKYDVCHKEFELKSTAASWNATSSVHHVYFHRNFQHHMVNCTRVFHHFMKLEDIARSANVKTLAYTTGTTCKHQRATWPELYRKLIVFLRIVVWHIRVFSPFLHVWGYGAGCCDVVKRSQKCTSRPNFDNLKHYIAWFKSLLSLKHEFSIRLFDPAACYMLNNVC